MQEVIRLWEEQPPTVIEGVPAESEFVVPAGLAQGTTFLRNVADPTLTVFQPVGPPRRVGVLVAPGGGWTVNAWTHEGLDVARWLASHGYSAFLLKYRLRASHPDQAVFEAEQAALEQALATRIAANKPRAISDLISTEDYRRARKAAAEDGLKALQVVRREADRLGVDPEKIGMIGFSAGAFLTVDVALDNPGEKLAFVAPIYGGETLGREVHSSAPPLFTAVAEDDFLVRVVTGLYDDWSAANRPVELHVFRRGSHGFGMVKQGLPSDGWTDLFLAWLDDLDLAGG